MKCAATNFLAAAAMLALGAVAAPACPLVYSMNFSGQFGIIDLATGAFTPIGTGLQNTPDGLAGAAGGPFYTVDAVTGHLLRIATNGFVADVGDTGTGSNVGPTGVSLLGALPNGALYALDFSNRLFRINEKTGALTLLGFLPQLPQQEMDYSGNMTTSLNGIGDKLYFTIQIAEGPGKIGPNLYVIDPATLSVDTYPLTLPGRVIGSGLANDQFYLFDAEGDIVKLNTLTHEVVTVASYESGLTEETPPFTGIFGIVAPVEPDALTVTKKSEAGTDILGRSHWGSRATAKRELVCQ